MGIPRNDYQHSWASLLTTYSLGYAALLTAISRPTHRDLIESGLITSKLTETVAMRRDSGGLVKCLCMGGIVCCLLAMEFGTLVLT